MSKLVRAIVGTVVALSVGVADASIYLERVSGQSYSYDSSTGLFWLFPSTTEGYSFFDIKYHQTPLTNLWRYATVDEANELLARNLPSLLTSPSQINTQGPWQVNVYNAPPQQDINDEIGNLIYALGGYTSTIVGIGAIGYGGDSYILEGLVEIPSCPNYQYNGCVANTFISLLHDTNGMGYAWLDGGSMYEYPTISFLVSSSTELIKPAYNKIPEPSTILLAGLALAGLGVTCRKKAI